MSMSGQLFTDYFLREGIRGTAEWQDSEADFRAFRRELSVVFRDFQQHFEPNEETTEQDLIIPVLRLLGWNHFLARQSMPGGGDFPDMLLYKDAESRSAAAGQSRPRNRFRDVVVIEESKRAGTPLDARATEDIEEPEDPNPPDNLPLFRDDAAPYQPQRSRRTLRRTPHGQIQQYLKQADDTLAGDGIRWGILTDGYVWRLYDYQTRPRATAYFEVNLRDILGAPSDDGQAQSPLFGDDSDEPDTFDELRLFHLLFRRESFSPQSGATTGFLEAAIEEGKRYEQRVAQDLSRVVFDDVFPRLVSTLAARASDTHLIGIRDSALIFLYRLLFVLYAEDRGLLPVNDNAYANYSLRKAVRDDVATKKQSGAIFSGQADTYYRSLLILFRLIDGGDDDIGLPPYNGGLFSSREENGSSLLDTVSLPDSVVAEIVYALSHRVDSTGLPQFVNYRDLSVQQLGSIYERLLEREPERDEDGIVTIRPNPYARKDSGSYYTPQELVDLVVDRTLGPLVEERLAAFETAAKQLLKGNGGIVSREEELKQIDPAEATLRLSVLDPSMGSGHFLVSAADYLTDYIVDLVEYVPAVPEWPEASYVSPLVERIEVMREQIEHKALKAGWTIDQSQLTDQALIRRLVLKNCIYGVDKNPLAVELAKVSLWLHSFTVGAPLSFLDHHLHCGDSLLGLRVGEALENLSEVGSEFALRAIRTAVHDSSVFMREIESLTDIDIAEVRESRGRFEQSKRANRHVSGMLDFFCGAAWRNAKLSKRDRSEFSKRLAETLRKAPSGEYEFLTQPPHPDDPAPQEMKDLWHSSRAVAEQERFIHWETAFPTIWENWHEPDPEGGFDVVIGNPPWDRIKLQEVEWFASRMPEVSRAPTAAARKAAIAHLRQQESPLADDFDRAKEHADILSAVVRNSGHYPLLGRGDTNLYSLFVERAMSLVKPDGIVGLLTPSGIYGDRTAADFFKEISTNGRLAGLYDFENRKIFFKDIHASFKFCALIFGGKNRQFDETRAAFFLHDAETAADTDSERVIPLSSADFSLINPNTRTAPIFRTRRDAEITRRIYERHPVLVDRSGKRTRQAWPVQYQTMFHMTNDSRLFRTAEQLRAEGFYPAESNRYKRDEEVYLPLYQGRMIWHFDHRSNSVDLNPENTHNPYLSVEVTAEQHADPGFLPESQYFVPEDSVDEALSEDIEYLLGFRDITNPTNERTLIAAIAPRVGFGNTLPLMMIESSDSSSTDYAFLLANLNSLCLDYIVRQKAQGTHLNWYILEQLPVIAPKDYDLTIGDTTARELVRDHVLRLTYTAHNMAPFATDLGYGGEPFAWDEEERRHLRARLDALYFRLYGLSKGDAEYVLDTFPIVKRNDRKNFRRYRTQDMILAYMDALAAGDPHTTISV